MGAHSHASTSSRSLLLALFLTAGFALVELVGGLLANSLALLGDAGHMATDAAALGLGALAALLSRRGASQRYSFGLQRAEVLGALINVLFMYGVVAAIAMAAFARLREPEPVAGLSVMLVAGAGLLINLLVLHILHRGEQTLNIRGAMLHVLGDLLGSVAAIVAGAVIWWTGWTPIDPLLSLLICAVILMSSTRLLLESLHVVMEGVPAGLSLTQVGKHMAAADPEVLSVHDLHIWTLSSQTPALSAHVVVRNLAGWPRILARLREDLHHQFGIDHVTLQPEVGEQAILPLEALPGEPD